MPPFVITKKVLEQEARILGDELYLQERSVLLEFIERLRGAESSQDFHALHISLIGRAKARQEVAGEIKAAKSEHALRIKDLVKQAPKPIGEISAEQRDLEFRDHQLRVNDALRWLTLTIGDGLAWRALNYDRAGMGVLGQGERVARFADKVGFDAEANHIGALWDDGVFTIHNDLTTCLRHGDVTAIRPHPRATTNREIEIFEIKASGILQEDSPQLVRLEEATTLLNDGQVLRAGGRRDNVHRLDIPYRTYLANLRDLSRKARKEGYAAARVGAGCWALVTNLSAWQDDVDALAKLDGESQKRIGWPTGDHKAFEFLSAARRIRDRRESYSSLAPLSIFPLDPEDVVDTMMGLLNFKIAISGVELEKAFAKRGIRAEVAIPPRSADHFLQATKRYGTIERTVLPSPQLREQMLVELMTPECAVKSTEVLLDEMPEHEEGIAQANFVSFADESKVWENYG